jgi:serine/threonine protein phosphatase PrpC
MARRFSVSSYSAQGKCFYQEDRFLVADIAVPVRGGKGKLLAVMDGHGGKEVSDYLATALDETFRKAIAGAEGDPGQALRLAFGALQTETEHFRSGSTLSMVYVPQRGRRAYVGILGDSPVAVYMPGKYPWISPEHNVFNPAEVAEVVKRGGELVGGYFYPCVGASQFDLARGLQLSRALGDKDFSQVLDRQPQIFSLTIGPGSLILIATDGITDHVLNSKARIANIIDSLRATDRPSAEKVVKRVLRFSQDNVTAIVWHWRLPKAK